MRSARADWLGRCRVLPPFNPIGRRPAAQGLQRSDSQMARRPTGIFARCCSAEVADMEELDLSDGENQEVVGCCQSGMCTCGSMTDGGDADAELASVSEDMDEDAWDSFNSFHFPAEAQLRSLGHPSQRTFRNP